MQIKRLNSSVTLEKGLTPEEIRERQISPCFCKECSGKPLDPEKEYYIVGDPKALCKSYAQTLPKKYSSLIDELLQISTKKDIGKLLVKLRERIKTGEILYNSEEFLLAGLLDEELGKKQTKAAEKLWDYI